MLQVHKMFLFLNSLGCTNYQTLLAMISLLSYGNPDPFWGCIGKLAKQVEGEHTTFYVLFWLAAKCQMGSLATWHPEFDSQVLTSTNNTEHAWILSLRCWSWPHSHKWTSELNTFESSTTVVHLWICEGKKHPLSQFLNKQVHASTHLV